MTARVLVSIVTYNSDRYLKTCLESLQVQSYKDFSISLWDNASTDGTGAIIEEYRNFINILHLSQSNVGFSAAHNRLISPPTEDASSDASSEYVLVINPDIILDTQFLDILTQEMDRDQRAGSATGKLWLGPGDEVLASDKKRSALPNSTLSNKPSWKTSSPAASA